VQQSSKFGDVVIDMRSAIRWCREQENSEVSEEVPHLSLTLHLVSDMPPSEPRTFLVQCTASHQNVRSLKVRDDLSSRKKQCPECENLLIFKKRSKKRRLYKPCLSVAIQYTLRCNYIRVRVRHRKYCKPVQS
jgi:hypothetical protein